MIQVSVPDRYDASWMSALVSELSRELDDCVKTNRRMYIGSNVDTELVVISPNGTKHKIKANNDGSLSTEVVV